jgi:hypothetical protein
MKIWRIEVKIEADDDLSEDEIINLLESVNHPSVEYAVVSKTDKYPDNKFLRGFIYIRQNIRWWRSHIDPRPSLLVDDSMFWDILCSK